MFQGGSTAVMVLFQSHIYLLLSILCVCNVQALDKYTAAVYEHVVIVPDDTDTPVTAAQALELMNKNMDLLEMAIKEAAQKGAHIIVTPECALYGFFFTRDTIFPYLEDIPDPEVEWIPCTDPKRFGLVPVQERLSCMAKNNSIYVVANMGDKKRCKSSDATCPEDGHYFYNTNVVFDAEGKLVARYHKFHLFFEDYFNRPQEPERVTFNTSFGTFGIFTCFDILFYDPAVALIDDLNVDSVLFPTAWRNVLPHLGAIEFHSSWAMTVGVNLLSSNINNKDMIMTGSGVFPPDRPGAYYYNRETEEGRLVLLEVSSHPRVPPLHCTISWNLYATSIPRFSTDEKDFIGTVIYDNFTFTELTKRQGNSTVCHNYLCCHLSYSMVDKREDEVYALGAFDGMHTAKNGFYLQICTLLKCKSTDLKTCGRPVETSFTKFESFSLSGTFGMPYVFPLVLYSGIQLGPDDFQVLKDGRLVSRSSISRNPILTATLFGRWFEKDPPKLDNALL